MTSNPNAERFQNGGTYRQHKDGRLSGPDYEQKGPSPNGAKDPETKTFVDSGQILNTGGIDVASCSGDNEGHDWVNVAPVEDD